MSGPNFERDLHKLIEKFADIKYAKNMYSALCNMRWKHRKTQHIYDCSWRYAGGLVAGLRCEGEDYLDFYCGGNEGIIDKEIYNDLCELGWKPKPYPGRQVVIADLRRVA